MHFWIDKRSQQCGFGRSRVAASLTGAGGSGVGLSFGHPPRRISSGSGSKASSRSTLPDCHHSNAASSSGSRSHQYQHQHQHQQLQHQQQQLQHASNNNNLNGGNNYQQSHTHSSNNSNYTSNSNTANITANASVTGATIQSTTSVTLNNNPHQYAYQQTNHHSSSSMQSPHAPGGNSNIVNNNNATTSTSTATAADVRCIAPATHNFNQRGAALLQNNVGAQSAPLYHQQANQCYDMRSYHHPQFGNMSVRHYQYPGRNCNGPTHANATSAAAHSYRSGIGSNSGTRTIVGAATVAPSMSNMQHMDQMVHRQQHGYSHAASTSAQSNESIMGGSAPISTNTTNTASYAVANTAHRYSSAAINMRTSNMTVDTGGGDAQLLPSHLKCGMCASLVLASVFVAGAKFYFDHQGTGLEVLIFCAFSATFFLAACTVSLCRVPKGLLPSGRNAVLGAQHHADGDSGMNCARAPYGRRDMMNSDGSGELVGSDDIHGAPLCGQLQLIEDSASAGPPPYHIAIYFPETENSGKRKEVPIDDESPPPSYDKILI
ncbi:uncharacterized protein DDB_G0283357 [Anastrepha obliqua]|uniref:uncharacterized protein DDB_G0283357 n=1 Tax=Anastrepha obliqua TaxID=95512 RepID=UPI0024097287|nr:uncharacterized protein DDB_G0283357 [Anastrepha obliqua]